jgi:hypothetical protein
MRVFSPEWQVFVADVLTDELKASLVSLGTSQQEINKLTSKDAIDLFVRDWQQKRKGERRSKSSMQNTPDASIFFSEPRVFVQHSNDELFGVLGKVRVHTRHRL